MGLYDRLTVLDPRFVCSEGHALDDLPYGSEFQSKDFGCTMGTVTIDKDGTMTFAPGGWGHPECDPFNTEIEIYCACPRCPAFVQRGTGNFVPCSVEFKIITDGYKITSVERTSKSTKEWIEWEPKQPWMVGCEGPMSYADAQHLHIYYGKLRPVERAELEQRRNEERAKRGQA